MANTRHNLTQRPIGGGAELMNPVRNDYGEVCVYCRTPHGASTNAPAPRWNKRLRSDGLPANGVGTYTSYATLNTPSLDGIVAPVGSISVRACRAMTARRRWTTS